MPRLHYIKLEVCSSNKFQDFHQYIIINSIEGADVVRFIKAQRIKWLGHIQRMDQARPTRKLLDWKPMVTRPVGKPRQRWQEDVMEDLKKLKVKN
jgi:hypothetical protein